MTIEEIRSSDKLWLTPDDIAQVLESNPQQIRMTAREYPERLGFPVTIIGKYTKFPRIPFLRFLGLEAENVYTIH